MNIEEVNEVMVALKKGLDTAIGGLVVLPGYQGVRITARFRSVADPRKGHDVLLDSDGSVTVQPQNYSPAKGGRGT